MEIDRILAEKKAAMLELQEDIRALERVQRMIGNGVRCQAVLEYNIDLAELRKQRTQKEAMDYIANKHDGVVKVNEAKELLLEAGFIKGDPKYAYGHLFRILREDDEGYESIGNGSFKKR